MSAGRHRGTGGTARALDRVRRDTAVLAVHTAASLREVFARPSSEVRPAPSATTVRQAG